MERVEKEERKQGEEEEKKRVGEEKRKHKEEEQCRCKEEAKHQCEAEEFKWREAAVLKRKAKGGEGCERGEGDKEGVTVGGTPTSVAVAWLTMSQLL
jgi:hypothetical protein